MKKDTPSQRAKEITKYWQYKDDIDMLIQLLRRVRALRININKFEVENNIKR